MGGPEMIRLPNGRLVAAPEGATDRTRRGTAGWATALWWVDLQNGRLIDLLRLPSAGDCSYPGMVYHDEMLWVSYYSAHEEPATGGYGKTNLTGQSQAGGKGPRDCLVNGMLPRYNPLGRIDRWDE